MIYIFFYSSELGKIKKIDFLFKLPYSTFKWYEILDFYFTKYCEKLAILIFKYLKL